MGIWGVSVGLFLIGVWWWCSVHLTISRTPPIVSIHHSYPYRLLAKFYTILWTSMWVAAAGMFVMAGRPSACLLWLMGVWWW
jgi:hypothetical protein